MIKTFAFILFCCVYSFTFAQKTIVLVHGAWSNASVWYAVAPALKARGYTVITVDLPGRGADTLSLKSLTLQQYAVAVEKAIGNHTDIVLLGHSMGGLVISQVAEDMPDKISKLIYLTAFVPKDGDSFFSVAESEKDNQLSKFLTIDQLSGSVKVSAEGVLNYFAEDALPALKEFLVKNIQPEPMAPLDDKVSLSKAKFGKVKKSFIFALNDKAITYPYQKKMADAAGITKTDLISTSHCPMFSQPTQLAALIAKQAQ